jgi:glutathione S-transferase
LYGGYYDEGAFSKNGGVNPKLNLQFYTRPGGMCPYAARTHLTLIELNVTFTTIEVPPGRPDWYVNHINPRGKVLPALQIPSDGNAILYESAICNEYLCDRFIIANNNTTDAEQHRLMPRSALSRANIRLLNDHYDTVVGPAQSSFLMNKDPAKDNDLVTRLEQSLDVYEKALREQATSYHGGPLFLTGESFTLADVHLLPFFYRLVIALRHYKQYELDPHRFSHLLQWHDACSQRPSVRAVTPSPERVMALYQQRFVERDYAFGGD